jgi:hypothetical protein
MVMIPLLATHATDGDWVSWTTMAAQRDTAFGYPKSLENRPC